MAGDLQSRGNKQRILIVEDEPFIRLALESMLPELGFEVAGSAKTVSKALDIIANEQVDGAVLDVNLGLEKADSVADALAARQCPFIFMTGHSLANLPARHAHRVILQKPFGFDTLEAITHREFGPPGVLPRTAKIRAPIESEC